MSSADVALQSWFGHEFLRLDLPNLGPAKHGAPSQKPFGHRECTVVGYEYS